MANFTGLNFANGLVKILYRQFLVFKLDEAEISCNLFVILSLQNSKFNIFIYNHVSLVSCNL